MLAAQCVERATLAEIMLCMNDKRVCSEVQSEREEENQERESDV